MLITGDPGACSFLVVVCGFAFAAEHIFGFVLADYHNFTSSFSTLLRFVLGIFDYRALAEVGAGGVFVPRH